MKIRSSAMRLLPALALVVALTSTVAVAQDDTTSDSAEQAIEASARSALSGDDLITASTAPLPPEYRDGAEVRSWTSAGGLTVVREGTNGMICLADKPGDDRFHAACYHESLEPFMARGRDLRSDGLSRDEVQAARESEIEAGTLPMPEHPSALYSLTGPADSYDAEAKEVVGASPLYVIYIPYATTESTGLPTGAPSGQPWLMDPGKPWAHIMLIPPGDDE